MKLKISVLIIVILLLTNFVYAKDIIYSSKVIIDSAIQLDGKQIKYQGEAIGDKLYRENGEFGWINLNDGTNAIGIWMTKEQMNNITKLGEYQVKGDIVLVTGNLNSACKEHGGDLDIHATNIEIVEKGYVDKEQINGKIYTMFRLLTIPTAMILIIVYFIEQNREKKNKKDNV